MKLLPSLALFASLLTICTAPTASAQQTVKQQTNAAQSDQATLAQAILFHAPFDGSTQAAISQGDGKLLVADSSERKKILGSKLPEAIHIAQGQGRYGDALRFDAKTPEVVFYEGIECGYRPRDWSGSVSVWLKLDPNEDLEPGYCDPLQMTEKAWNDAAFFLDFDKFLPRDFRLGVFADYQAWNPQDTPWDDLPVAQRPMIVVTQPAFGADKWTHICFTWKHINAADDQTAQSDLYLNGRHQGSYAPVSQFTWEPAKAALMLGINYIGLMDDLVVFDRELSAEQVEQVYSHPIAELK